MTVTLGYWDIRGLGGHLRILLNYLNVPFEDKKYSDFDDWKAEKFTLGLEFPNLPYFIDNDGTKITQSLAILRHIARSHGLWPTEKQQVRSDQLEQELVDLRLTLALVAYDHANYYKSRAEWLEKSQVKLQQLDKAIGTGPWALGDKISYIDFLLYDALDFVRLFAPGHSDSYVHLQQFIKRFEELPTVKAYIQSSNYIRVPIFKPFAVWDGIKVVPDQL